jgi:ankyrin repeat protein
MTWHNAFDLVDMDDWRELHSALQAGWPVNERNNISETPLHRAAELGYTECVRVLVEWKADLNAADMHGATALHKAVIAQRNDVVEQLVKAGADIHAKTRGGKEPADYGEDGAMATVYLHYQAAKIEATAQAELAEKQKNEKGFTDGLSSALPVRKPLQIQPK